MNWTLTSGHNLGDIPTTIDDGVYSLIPTNSCHIKSTGDEQADILWFSTPVSTYVSLELCLLMDGT